jgi:predicted permease
LATIGLERLPRANEVRIDGVTVAVALALAAAAGLLIGLVPLADVLRINLSNALHDSGRTGTGKRARRMRQGLVTAQVGLAFVLLVGAGLLLASFRQLLRVDPGFKNEGVVTASTNAPRVRYAGDPELRTLLLRSLESIRGIPGVIAAGVTTSIPLGGSYSDSVILAEGYAMQPGESLISPHQASVSPGYFEAMNIALVRGRYFDDRDNETAPRAVIIDEFLARRFWPNADPIGRRMFQPQDINNLLKTDEKTVWLRVVGVVRSVRLEDLAGSGNTSGSYYFPYAQSTSRGYTFAVRTSADAATLARSVRAEIAKIDPELALFDVRTMAERSELSLAPRRTSMILALGFGALALFLCAVGIYGVLAYLVTQRRREIGIRIALGSTGTGIVKLVLREGLLLLGAGVILGGAGAFALRKAVQSEVYGVQPLDPLVIGGVLATLVVIGLTACALPARRASQVDPVVVLSEQ